MSQRLRSSDGRDAHALSLQAESASLEAGWNKIINLMKVVQNTGVMPANPKANAIIEHTTDLEALLGGGQ